MTQSQSTTETAKNLDRKRRRRSRTTVVILAISIVILYLVCVSLGSARLSLTDVWDTLLGNAPNWGVETIVRDIRAPRVLGAAIVGAALSLGGMAMQALFKNPMASPSVLGISSGASFGAAFYIAFGSAIVMPS